MSSTTLVTGGSDGSVRVWSLDTFSPIHRLAAHDNSVTSLQFDESRIVSGGSDGRVKVWDLSTGQLIRELSQPAEAVWRVAFESETAVVMASRGGRTIMEVWDFRPQEETAGEDAGAREMGDHVMIDVGEAVAAESMGARESPHGRTTFWGETIEEDDRMGDGDIAPEPGGDSR